MKLEGEIGEKILDSPLRRAREYAQTIAGSPSPIKRIVTKGTFQFEISPEKAGSLEVAPQTSPTKKKKPQPFGGAGAKVVMTIDPKHLALNSQSESKAAR